MAIIRRILGFAGSLLLLGGIFSPLAKVPFQGTFTLFRSGRENAIYVLVFGLTALVLSIRGKCRWLTVPGVASLTVVLMAAWGYQRQLDQAASGLRKIGLGLHRMVYDSVDLRWGWLALGGGALLLIISGLIREKP